MTERRITELLKGFESQEFKRFGEFLNSPFHNKNKDIIALFDFINRTPMVNNIIQIEYDTITRYLSEGLTFNDQKVRTVISDFVKMILKFYAQLGYEASNNYQKTLVLGAMNDRNLGKNFLMVLKETEQYFSGTFNKDEDYYYHKMFIDVESFNYKLVRDEEWQKESYKSISDSLDNFYVLSKLSLLHYMYYHINYLDDTVDSNLWMKDDVIKYINENLVSIKRDHPIVYLKYLILMTIINPDTFTYYKQLRDFAMKNVDNMKPQTQEYVFGAMVNYCMSQRNKGDMNISAERFKVFKFIEERTQFYKSGYISHIDFLNATISAIEVNKIQWAEYFYEKYHHKILSEFKEDTLLISKAQILYSRGQYDEAIELLNKVSYKSRYFYLRSKMTTAKIYYDTNSIEPIIYMNDAVRHYLDRNKKEISRINFELFSKFFKYISKILKMENPNKNEVKKLKKELVKEEYVASKDWLTKKLDDMLG